MATKKLSQQSKKKNDTSKSAKTETKAKEKHYNRKPL